MDLCALSNSLSIYLGYGCFFAYFLQFIFARKIRIHMFKNHIEFAQERFDERASFITFYGRGFIRWVMYGSVYELKDEVISALVSKFRVFQKLSFFLVAGYGLCFAYYYFQCRGL